MGIRGKSNDLIKSYLFNRTQFTKYNSAVSELSCVNAAGIPAGSILGPLLFNLMMIDMQFLDLDVKIAKFADDFLIILEIYPQLQGNENFNTFNLQKVLNGILSYYQANNFKLNSEKSFFMILGNINSNGLDFMLTTVLSRL